MTQRELSPYIESALQAQNVVPGMTAEEVHIAAGTPLPLPRREGMDYGLGRAEAYVVHQYGRLDTVWVFFDDQNTVILVER